MRFYATQNAFICRDIVYLNLLACCTSVKTVRLFLTWPPSLKCSPTGRSSISPVQVIGYGVTRRISESPPQWWWRRSRMFSGRPASPMIPGGASSTIGVALVVKAEPDGHTLLVTTGTPLVGARAFLKQIPYDPINGVAGITIAYDSAFVLSVRMEEKGTTFAQLLEKMRKDPDKYPMGGVSQTMRVLNHIITTTAKLKHLYVPYTGFATQQSDLLGGRIGIMMQAPNLSINMARANQTIAIAVGGPRRLKPLPGTQTVSETLPGVELPYWLGFFAPAKTPKPILDRLYLAFAESFKLPEAIEYMENSGTILAMRPELIPDFMVKEEAKWLRLARAAGVEPE